MTAPSFRVEGADELRKALRNVSGGLDDLKAAHAKAAKVVETATSPPHRTGRLAGTLRSSGQARAGVVRAGTAAVPYAPYVHFGVPSKGMAPRPFLYEAADERRSAVRDVFERSVSELVDKHGLD